MSKLPQIDSDISRAWSIPAPFYTDPQYSGAGETANLCPHMAGGGSSRSTGPKPGDYFTTELLGEPLLLVRGAQGELRGFYNVCRHRAGPPAEGCGSRKLFRCGYHGWTYGLDGALISAPEFEGQPGFDAKEFTLAPVRAEEWSNLIFVNLDPERRTIAEESGTPSHAGRAFWFYGNEVVRTAHLRHEVQLEDLRR